MDEQLKSILLGDLLASQRAFHGVQIQGLMSHQLLSVQALANHQTSAHFLDMVMNRDSVEISIPEAAAVSNLSSGQVGEKIAAMNAGHGTPSSLPSAANTKLGG